VNVTGLPLQMVVALAAMETVGVVVIFTVTVFVSVQVPLAPVTV
jgi:hypothetical protein